MLKQFEPDPKSQSTFKGKQNIMFLVAANDGKKITKIDKNALVARSGNPTNLATVSSEVTFDTSYTYPYTFTMLVANTNHGVEGEGTYDLRIYCNDPAFKVVALN